MTSQSRYVTGLAAIAALVLGASRELAPATRGPLLVALGLAIAVQAPLGWWLIRSVGTERFLLAWGAGLGARVLVVAVLGLFGVRLLNLAPTVLLLPVASLLVALLALEIVVVVVARPEVETG